jgi:hypothetical protein
MWLTAVMSRNVEMARGAKQGGAMLGGYEMKGHVLFFRIDISLYYFMRLWCLI